MAFEPIATSPPPVVEDNEVLPLPAIICIAIGGYILLIVIILLIRSMLMQKGFCKEQCSCCGKEGEPACCECWVAFADSCNCCKNPNVDACLNACCPSRKKMDCAEVIMCQCCNEGGCCGMCANDTPICDRLQKSCTQETASKWCDILLCCPFHPIISFQFCCGKICPKANDIHCTLCSDDVNECLRSCCTNCVTNFIGPNAFMNREDAHKMEEMQEKMNMQEALMNTMKSDLKLFEVMKRQSLIEFGEESDSNEQYSYKYLTKPVYEEEDETGGEIIGSSSEERVQRKWQRHVALKKAYNSSTRPHHGIKHKRAATRRPNLDAADVSRFTEREDRRPVHRGNDDYEPISKNKSRRRYDLEDEVILSPDNLPGTSVIYTRRHSGYNHGSKVRGEKEKSRRKSVRKEVYSNSEGVSYSEIDETKPKKSNKKNHRREKQYDFQEENSQTSQINEISSSESRDEKKAKKRSRSRGKQRRKLDFDSQDGGNGNSQ